MAAQASGSQEDGHSLAVSTLECSLTCGESGVPAILRWASAGSLTEKSDTPEHEPTWIRITLRHVMLYYVM